jgi:iron complex transport system substrate-binding protein
LRPSSEPRRIVCLLPAATETVYVLGAWDRVVAVSHECDFPPDAAKRPRATASRVEAGLPSAELDAALKGLAAKGQGTVSLDDALLRDLKPDLLIAQTTCDVCAVTPKELDAVVAALKPRPDVIDYHARTYEDVLAQVRQLGDALHRKEEAKREIIKQWGLAKEIRGRTQGLGRPRVAVLDWLEPLMFAGHWTQELVEMAGGEYGLVPKGQPSRWGSWDELEEYEPDIIVAAPCGRSLEASADELAAIVRRSDLWDLAAVEQGQLFVADGNKYFNRPGPRLVYSAALLARMLHGEHVPPLPGPLESGYARLEVPRAA